VHTYNSAEVLRKEYISGWVWPNRVRAIGAVDYSVGYENWDSAAALASGRDVFQLLYAGQLGTEDYCRVVVEGALDDAAARGYGGTLETAPNVGIELMDVILVSDDYAGGAGLSLIRRRVNGIVTNYDPLEGVWRQRLALEGC
jgi:hypothetical protein